MRYLNKILQWLTTERCIVLIFICMTASIAVPGCWKKEGSGMWGDSIQTNIYWVTHYIALTLMFLLLKRFTGSLVIEFLFLLCVGKVPDQFINPYVFSWPEQCYIIVVVLYLMAKKNNGKIE